MVVIFTAMLFIAVVAGIVACFTFLSLIPAIIAAIIGTPSLLWCGITAYGLIRRAQPLRPFDAEEQAESAARAGGKGRYITTADGRIVEYLVPGVELLCRRSYVCITSGSCRALYDRLSGR